MAKRAFYSCPTKPPYMAKYFGMIFCDPLDKKCTGSTDYLASNEEADIQFAIEHYGKIYIHPDSMHLLEPQVGDFIMWDEIYCGRIHGVNENNVLVWFASEDCNIIIPREEAHIIHRNNLAFHWPQFEEAV